MPVGVFEIFAKTRLRQFFNENLQKRLKSGRVGKNLNPVRELRLVLTFGLLTNTCM